ncbi:MAG: DUF4870 domain-containing protein [Acidobacteriota bacterium]
MPYCSQCGNQVQTTDAYCARCGSRQPAAAPARDFASGVSPRTASILCYVPWIGWLVAIVVLASSSFRNNRAVRFHAFQGLYLFVAWLIVQWVFKPFSFVMPGPHFPIAGILQMALLVLSVFMMIKASQGELYSLPVLGELADRSLAEK